MRRKEHYCKRVVNDFLRKLHEVLDSLYRSEQLNKRIAELLLFFNRRITECFFLSQIMAEQKSLTNHKFMYFSDLLLCVQNMSNLRDKRFTASFEDVVK